MAFAALVVACRRHDSAVTTNASAETAAPVPASAPVQADSVASASALSAPAPSASASPSASARAAAPPITDKERAEALREATEYGMLAMISSDAGLGDLLVGPGMQVRDAAAPPRSTSGSVRMGSLIVSGTTPSEVIQRIIRQSFGRFRGCYQVGLRSNPSLQGRVTTKFVIDKNGTVVTAQDGGSDLPDQTVVQCVVHVFTTLTFPQPDNGGVVVVSAPLMFDPK